MKTLRLSLLSAGLSLLASACAGTPTPKAPGADILEPYQCGDVQRINTFQGIFLASQPAPIDFEHAKKGGIKTIVNLRHPAEIKDFDEAQVVAAQGLTYVNLPWNGPDELTDAVFDRGRELLNNAERPMMMHCGSGNRVGPLWIAWRMLDGKQTWDQAYAEAVQIGMKTPAYAELAKAYVAKRQKG